MPNSAFDGDVCIQHMTRAAPPGGEPPARSVVLAAVAASIGCQGGTRVARFPGNDATSNRGARGKHEPDFIP